jgi:RHS repeat-associated protein
MERNDGLPEYFDHARSQQFNLGRFTSTDLLRGYAADGASWNRYSFASSNPLHYSDPLGFSPEGGDSKGDKFADTQYLCFFSPVACGGHETPFKEDVTVTAGRGATWMQPGGSYGRTTRLDFAQQVLLRTADLTQGPVNALGRGILLFSGGAIGPTFVGSLTSVGSYTGVYFARGGVIVLGRFGSHLTSLEEFAQAVGGRVLMSPIPANVFVEGLTGEIDAAAHVYFNLVDVVPGTVSYDIELTHILQNLELLAKTTFVALP